MKVYNTMTRRKENFVEGRTGHVSIYACGPTVYNLMHIGNARQICVFDTLRRYLIYKGYKVTYVLNFTDVDDKIIRKAHDNQVGFLDIANQYIEEFFTDAHGLNVLDADIHPRATAYIDEIVLIVSELIEKGYAYATPSGDVYFNTEKYDDYGALSHQPLDALLAGARIHIEEEKVSPTDFALWKAVKPGEPSWETPWGNGRPGWHIECSAMVRKVLGATIDIHGGGQDLVFPHHENELAQSFCCNGVPLARYWMHNGHVNVDNKKMSKSLGNFFTVREVAAKYGYEPIRYLMISSHYRSPINYCFDCIEQSAASLERLYNCRRNLIHLIDVSKDNISPINPAQEKLEADIYNRVLQCKNQFLTAMDDDLNTADALASIFELTREINSSINTSTSLSKELICKSLALFNDLASVLGILPEVDSATDSKLESQIELLLSKRTEARQNKDWVTADSIRDELSQLNVVLEDTPTGIKWHIGK